MSVHVFSTYLATYFKLKFPVFANADFDMIFFPTHSTEQGVDRIEVISKASQWFPYTLTMILEDHPVKAELAQFGD